MTDAGLHRANERRRNKVCTTDSSNQERPAKFRVSAGHRGTLAVRWPMCLVALAMAVATVGHATSATSAPGAGFGLPIDCKLGTSCWIVNYPDAGPGSAGLDFKCNHLTYDGHKGTDFAIRDLEAMRQGVGVVSSAAGEVVRVRDGIGDGGLKHVTEGRECGNGVVITHGDGWETQYCHLRDGSVVVRPGDRVRRGDRLGLVGMSGNTVYPHVQLSVRRNGATLDPFTGREVFSGCGVAGQSLWRVDARPTYSASQIVAVGFATGRVEMASIQRNAASPIVLSIDAPALVLWVVTLGIEPGDLLNLRITGPDGNTVLSRHKAMERTQIRRLDFGGRRVRGKGWTPGVYIGDVSLARPGSAETGELTTRASVTLR